MLLAICLLFVTKDALSQQSSNVIAPSAELDMLRTPVASTASRVAVARNNRSEALTITAVNLVCGSAPFRYVSAVTLPRTLQPGDSVILGTVSYTPSRTNEDFVGYLMVDHAPRLNSEDGEVRIHASSTVDSAALRPCMSVSLDASVFGPVLYGGQVIRELTVKNNLDSTRTIRCVDFTIQDRDAFSCVGKQFPMNVPPRSTGTIRIAFKPQSQKFDGSNDFMTDLLIEPMNASDECRPDIRIRGTGVAPTPSTAVIALTDTTHPLGMCSSEWQFVHDFTFQNQGSQEVTITDASLESGNSAMSLTSLCGAELPVTLAPGDKVSARIAYTAPNEDVHYDHIVFSLDNGGRSVFAVQALRAAPSSVRNGLARRQIALSVKPNPSTGTTRIELASGYKGDMAIYTTTGLLVAEQKNVTSWIWRAPTNAGASLASGEYTLRVTCHDVDGATLTRTERLVVLGH